MPGVVGVRIAGAERRVVYPGPYLYLFRNMKIPEYQLFEMPYYTMRIEPRLTCIKPFNRELFLLIE